MRIGASDRSFVENKEIVLRSEKSAVNRSNRFVITPWDAVLISFFYSPLLDSVIIRREEAIDFSLLSSLLLFLLSSLVW